MYVYSGECRLCECGIDTGQLDIRKEPLSTGDIVIVFTEEGYTPDHLSVVVSDQYQSFNDGKGGVKHQLTGKNEPFIMGIKDVSWNGEWKVLKVKDHFDVINGEKWEAFGIHFNQE